MLKSRVIPCLDVKDGRVVKGVNFVALRDAGDPVQCAIAYDAAGADELCFLDITASHEDRAIILDVVQRTAEACFMPLTAGGGVRTLEDIRALLLAGADKVAIMTAAVANREIVREAALKFGSQCIVVAIDAKQTAPGKWEVFTHGGRKATGFDALAYGQEVVDARRRRNSIDVNGSRWHQTRFRSRSHPRCHRGRPSSGHCFRRCWHARSSRRGNSRRWRERGARRLDFSLRRIYDRASQAAYGKLRIAGAARSEPARAGCGAASFSRGNRVRRHGNRVVTRFTLDDLAAIISARANASASASYTKSLLDAGTARAAKKLGEEAVEVVIAVMEGDAQAITCESADLLYHLLVVLHQSGVSLEDVCAELERRTGQSGHAEKAARRADHT